MNIDGLMCCCTNTICAILVQTMNACECSWKFTNNCEHSSAFLNLSMFFKNNHKKKVSCSLFLPRFFAAHVQNCVRTLSVLSSEFSQASQPCNFSVKLGLQQTKNTEHQIKKCNFFCMNQKTVNGKAKKSLTMRLKVPQGSNKKKMHPTVQPTRWD